jgi:hypothetical protein
MQYSAIIPAILALRPVLAAVPDPNYNINVFQAECIWCVRWLEGSCLTRNNVVSGLSDDKIQEGLAVCIDGVGSGGPSCDGVEGDGGEFIDLIKGASEDFWATALRQSMMLYTPTRKPQDGVRNAIKKLGKVTKYKRSYDVGYDAGKDDKEISVDLQEYAKSMFPDSMEVDDSIDLMNPFNRRR